MKSETGDAWDVIIVGAGIAGAALAHALGKQGRKVFVIERDLSEPDRIVGELLQPGGINQLKDLGLEKCLDGIDSVEVYGYGILWNGQEQCLPYPVWNGEQPKGKSFHHGRFVQKLREAAQTVENVKLVQGTANRLIEDKDCVIGVAFRDSNQEIKEVYAPLTVVCDGCFSNFRRTLGLGKPSLRSHFVGLILEDCTLPYKYHGNVILANPGPILGYQIGSNEVRILVDIPDPLPSSSNGDLIRYLTDSTAPQLPEKLRPAFLKALNDKKIRSMPNSLLHPAEQKTLRPGMIAIGDTWNMRHPLTGGGMTVAFSDVVHIRNILANVKNLSDQQATTDALQSFFGKRKPLASTINILACALHSVFAASEDPVLPYMREACWNYFKFGGEAVKGPMSLLSGLCSSSTVLLTHFFMVALYGSVRAVWPPYPSNFLLAYKILRAGSWIVIPLMRGENVFRWFTALLSVIFWKSRSTPAVTN